MISLVDWAEKGRIPDALVRLGIKRLLLKRLKQDAAQALEPGKSDFVEKMRRSPLALGASDANHQHYEVPTEVFERMLGPHLKYSCAYYPSLDATLAEAESAMLALSCERAQLIDGQSILERGCGWGSLTLYMAETFPSSQITAVSNSNSQREHIERQAAAKGFDNIQVITADMNVFETSDLFDRVVSIEMFEHMRNYEQLFQRISSWLKADGRLFFHIFCHRNLPYFFEDDSKDDWMARHFFTGGLMPSFDLPQRFEGALRQRSSWKVNGQHYARTCADWLSNLDTERRPILAALAGSDNPESELILWQRWRMFVMACQELFAHQGGETWFVGHYLFEQNAPQSLD